MTEPEQPTRPAETVDPELLRRKQEVQLAEWEARQASERRLREERQNAELEVWRNDQQALDVAQPTTMRQRLAHAAALARSDVVPRGFRGGARPGDALNERQERIAAASIVLAQEWGGHLGFPGLAALQHLQVVEGNIGVKPASARGMILAAGCDLDDEVTYSPCGFPVAHMVTITRPGGRPKAVTFRIEQALRAGLISEITRDGNGDIVGVVARSDKGKPLPWESYTEDMLRHRATARMVSLYATDICGGMDLAPEFDEPSARPSGAGPTAAVAETLAQVAPEPAPADSYDPAEDLREIAERLGIPDGRAVPWWEHADAQTRLNVRRRSRVQLAADRIAAWVMADPVRAHERGLDKPLSWGEIVDADIVEAEEQGPAASTDDGAVVTGADMASTGAPAAGPDLRLGPWEWEERLGVRIDDPDGWRIDGKPWDDALTRTEFVRRMGMSTIKSDTRPMVAPFRDEQMDGPLPGVDDAALPEAEFEMVATEHAGLIGGLPDPEADRQFAADLEAEHAAAVAAELTEASQQEDRPAEPTAEDLLAVVDALAERAGQTRNQYARRAIALRRRNPEDWTVRELADFIRSVAPDADLGSA